MKECLQVYSFAFIIFLYNILYNVSMFQIILKFTFIDKGSNG